ncbi:hypothetical protein DFR50_1353 [Roseiarcus fermentans]|uniref:Transglycosylase-like protein with SLT domain n=1 Tax=Roseiarcus fermentans TaxID=1473586 RepID=A0A366ES29_9HYPH|nr:hypothetical protein DFR50_1353 [Roseiarcus fermentans]
MFGNTPLGLCRASGPPRSGRMRLRLRCTTASVVLGIGVGAIGAHADPSLVLPSGLPVQVHPTFPEPGLPAFSFPAGGSSSLGGSSGSVGDGGSGSGGSGSTGGSGDAYNTMMAQDWGSQAADAAAAMGVSATALAATCVMESNCQNVGAASGSSATGAFQMINSTYTADISGAVAYDPGIAGSIVSGLAGQMDPATEAYAASYELRSDALLLQSNGIDSPTVLAVRAVYQFGAGSGPAVATANDSENIAELTGLSGASLAANGLTSSSSVGDWRATIVAKLGSATANQTVLAQ